MLHDHDSTPAIMVCLVIVSRRVGRAACDCHSDRVKSLCTALAWRQPGCGGSSEMQADSVACLAMVCRGVWSERPTTGTMVCGYTNQWVWFAFRPIATLHVIAVTM